MFDLANDQLRVRVLDPETDRARLGPRFCWGAYVWQVEDRQLGPLLSGPEGPIDAPDPFNGHGLPESFRDRTRAGEELTWKNGRGLAPGVGVLERAADGTVEVREPCSWEIRVHPDRLEFETTHGDGARSYRLVRMLQLSDRDLISTSRFSNVGREPLSLQWFAHPFFALDDAGGIQVQLPGGAHLPENDAFVLDGRILTPRRRFHGVKDGHFELLGLPTGEVLDATLRHPQLRHIRFRTSFVPSECPIWMNSYTFSIEPYQTLHLETAQTAHWALRYTFAG
jgi:hypothetical protein